MPRSNLELAGIFRQHGQAYRDAHPLPLLAQELKAH